MLSPRWRKVVRDLWGYKARTLLVVLSVAVGVFAVGVIGTSRIVMSGDLHRIWMAFHPPSAVLYTDPFDDELVAAIRAMEGVRAAEGRRSVMVRVQVGRDQWRDLALTAIPDFKEMNVEKITPVSGVWPPPERRLLIERASVEFIGAGVGDTVVIDPPLGKPRPVPIAGLVHDRNVPSPVFSNRAFGYITMNTLEWLGEPRAYNELHLIVDGDGLDKAHIARVVEEVRRKVEKSGRTVHYTWIPEPGRPVVQAPDTVVAEGEVVPARAATLSFPAGGIAAEVLVAAGERVKEGQPLIRLAAGQLEAAVAQAEAELRRAQARLRELKAGARSQEIAMAEAAVAAAEARLAKLKKEKAPSEDIRIAEAELRRARAELDLTRAGARPEAIAAAEADVAAATAALQRARAALADTELRAPFAGTVIAVDIRPGEYAAPGVAVLRLADLSSWQVETRDLTEIQVAQVREGQPVTVTLDALPGVELRGKVQRIEGFGENRQGDITYKVVVALDEQDQRLRWNMTATVEMKTR